MLVYLIKNIRKFGASRSPLGRAAKKGAALTLILASLDGLRKRDEVQDGTDALEVLCEQVMCCSERSQISHFYKPHVYIFIIRVHVYKKSTSRIMLPHASTISRLYSYRHLDSCAEQEDEELLAYIKKKAILPIMFLPRRL